MAAADGVEQAFGPVMPESKDGAPAPGAFAQPQPEPHGSAEKLASAPHATAFGAGVAGVAGRLVGNVDAAELRVAAVVGAGVGVVAGLLSVDVGVDADAALAERLERARIAVVAGQARGFDLALGVVHVRAGDHRRRLDGARPRHLGLVAEERAVADVAVLLALAVAALMAEADIAAGLAGAVVADVALAARVSGDGALRTTPAGDRRR